MGMTPPPDENPSPRPIDDMTLAEIAAQFFRAPRRTIQALRGASLMVDESPVAAHDAIADQPPDAAPDARAAFALSLMMGLAFAGALASGSALVWRGLIGGDVLVALLWGVVALGVAVAALLSLKSSLGATGDFRARFAHPLPFRPRQWLKLALWGAAIALGVAAGYTFLEGQPRTEDAQLMAGLPYLLAAFSLWLFAAIFAGDALWASTPLDRTPPRWHWQLSRIGRVHPVRVFAIILTPVLMIVVWNQTAFNQFRPLGFWAWVLSIICVLIALAPSSWSPLTLGRRILALWPADGSPRLCLRLSPKVIIFIVILLVGIAFRLHDFGQMPPQMTSDHKEKILDAQRILDGSRDVFFMNNGGREGFQMYAMALFSQLPGQGMTHHSLMLLAVIESIITLPIVFWLGRQVMGRDQREAGDILGLILMALLAVSYWHLAISRLALRIVLTPLVGALLLGFLIRAIRHNRRGDFIAAGLVLGFGLYTYQAVRMMPVMVLAAVGIAILWRWRDLRAITRYVVHLAALVAVSLVIFMPLLRFSTDYFDSFWMRSAGRVFGDDVIQERGDDGELILRDANIEDRLAALIDNLPELGNNIRNALLMFHWRGDEAWINGVPFHPQLDPIAGALLMVGLAACAVALFRLRDPVYLLLPLAVFIMLLPSALSIAMTNENPSATRTSGAIPPTFVIMSLPLLGLVMTLKRLLTRRLALKVGGVVVALMVYLSLGFNWTLYYDDYRQVYRYTTWPYRIPAEILRGFHMSDGHYANAYMIGYTLWWDYRIIGIEAGALDWPNGIVGIENLPRWMSDQQYCDGGDYALHTNRDFLVFHHRDDDDTAAQLREWFPQGYSKRIITYNSPAFDFYIFRVPAMGDRRFYDFVQRHVENPSCPPIPPPPIEQGGD